MKSDRLPLILWIVAGVAAVVGLGLWGYYQTLTIYTSLILIAALVCAGVAAYLKPEPIEAVTGARQVQEGSNVLAMIVLLGAILLVLNMIFNPSFPRPAWLSWLPSFEKQWDLTASQTHTLSQATIDILKDIKEPVQILAFYSAQSADQRGQDKTLLENYTRPNSLITLQWIDPVAQPTLAQQYGIAYDGSVILQAGDRRQAVDSVGEEALTAAFIKVLRKTQPVLYFTTGHGERALDDYAETGFSQIKSALESSGYQVRTLATAITATMPADAAAVIVGSPQLSFAAGEVDALKVYLAKGGKAMLLFDYAEPDKYADSLFGLGSLLDEWGVTVRNDLVADAEQSLVLSLERVYIAPAVANYGHSPITQKLKGQVSVFAETRSITQTRQVQSVLYTALAQSSAQSWGVSDVKEVRAAMSAHRAPQPGPQDAHGPLTLAASLENSQTKAQLVVFGGAGFAANTWVGSQTANRDFFLSAVNWLVTQSQGDEFQLPPKGESVARQMQPFTLDKLVLAGLISLCLLPVGMTLAGVWVWLRRR
jgi:ABC-type uncharacterized transport system involved in gliding motility auxiliary subunit